MSDDVIAASIGLNRHLGGHVLYLQVETQTYEGFVLETLKDKIWQ